VSLTTPPAALTLAVLQLWEGEMLAVEQRWPGCRFLGWRTRQTRDATTCSTLQTPAGSTSSTGRTPVRDAACVPQRRSQRDLVTASLLRCPPANPAQAVRAGCGPR